MKLLTVTLAALVSLFTVSIYWMVIRSPFQAVVSTLNSTMTGATTNPQGQAAISNLTAMYGTAMVVFVIITILSIIYWWYMKMQEREIVTEAVYY